MLVLLYVLIARGSKVYERYSVICKLELLNGNIKGSRRRIKVLWACAVKAVVFSEAFGYWIFILAT